MVQWASSGERVPHIAARLGVAENTVRNWLHRFDEAGLSGLLDEVRTGRPPTSSADEVSLVVATALTKPDALALPFGHWTLDRLEVDLNEQKGIAIKRSRINEILQAEGLRWRKDEHWFGERVDPDFAKKKGLITTLSTAPPEASLVVNLDEMGPESAKRFLGQQVVHTQLEGEKGQQIQRARQEIDYGRRAKGYIFGAFQPATGEAFTLPYDRRTTENWIDVLNQVEAWVPASIPRIYAILDNLAMHRATDVLLFALEHPRWEFVFQPTYAAYLNLIEPWWKTLRSLALKGRRLETWEQVCQAVAKATAYWNAHRHPFVWGRRRHRPRRSSGIAIPANVRSFGGCTTK